MNINEILQLAVKENASDIFVVAGLPVTMKCHGEHRRLDTGIMSPDKISVLVDEIYQDRKSVV